MLDLRPDGGGEEEIDNEDMEEERAGVDGSEEEVEVDDDAFSPRPKREAIVDLLLSSGDEDPFFRDETWEGEGGDPTWCSSP